MLVYPVGSCELQCAHASIREFYVRMAERLSAVSRALAGAAWPLLGDPPAFLVEEAGPSSQQCSTCCKALNVWVLFVLVRAPQLSWRVWKAKHQHTGCAPAWCAEAEPCRFPPPCPSGIRGAHGSHSNTGRKIPHTLPGGARGAAQSSSAAAPAVGAAASLAVPACRRSVFVVCARALDAVGLRWGGRLAQLPVK